MPVRSITVGVRLDPRLRFLVEVAARKQRRSLSSFIEWALRDSLERIRLVENGPSLSQEAASLWDVDEADRFARLAEAHPDLLTYEEQIKWKRQQESRRAQTMGRPKLVKGPIG